MPVTIVDHPLGKQAHTLAVYAFSVDVLLQFLLELTAVLPALDADVAQRAAVRHAGLRARP